MVSRRMYGYLILAAAFAVGVACGGGAAFAYLARKHAAILRDDEGGPETRRLRALVRRLDLDGEQEQRVRTILIEERDTMRELGRQMLERCGEPLRDQKAHAFAAIRDVLRHDQRQRYDDIMKDRRERFWLGPRLFRHRGEVRDP